MQEKMYLCSTFHIFTYKIRKNKYRYKAHRGGCSMQQNIVC